MDQEEFEDMADIGERPVGGVPVSIPAAADSDARNIPPIAFQFNDDSGRITLGDNLFGQAGGGVIYVAATNPDGSDDHFLALYNGASNNSDASDYFFHLLGRRRRVRARLLTALFAIQTISSAVSRITSRRGATSATTSSNSSRPHGRYMAARARPRTLYGPGNSRCSSWHGKTMGIIIGSHRKADAFKRHRQ